MATDADASSDCRPDRHRSMLGHIPFGIDDPARASAFVIDPHGCKLGAVHQ
jgi:hypothetical protein